jgi:hypothetical protein
LGDIADVFDKRQINFQIKLKKFMKRYHLFCIVLLHAFLFGSQLHAQTGLKISPRGWVAVYSNDENGEATAGSKTELINGLRAGYALKVGWGWKRMIADSLVSLEHFASPVFTTVINEKDVSVVIDPHPLLKSYFQIDQQTFADSVQQWQCVLTTRGTFNAIVFSPKTGEKIKDWPQRHKMVWYLQYP